MKFQKLFLILVNLASQPSNLEVLGLKGKILIFVDYDLQGYKLSCCGSFVLGLGFFSFISIAFGHTVWFCV